MTELATQGELVGGILGGLGPQATVDFMSKLVAATSADGDQDHVHLLIDHNPKVPNRHASIAGTGPNVGPELANMAKTLQTAGADFLVMVCNTAHAYAPEIRAAVSIPFISIVDVVVEALQAYPVRRVGVMAADGCLRANLFQSALMDAGYQPVLWTNAELEEFMQLVYRIKAGDRDKDIAATMRQLAGILQQRGAELLIAGCTEIPLFLSADDTPLPLLSSTDLLVERTINLAREGFHNGDLGPSSPTQ